MTAKPGQKSQARTQVKMLAAKASQPHSHKRQGIVKQHLYRMENKRILNHIYHAIGKTSQHACPHAKAIANKQ